MLVCGKTNIQLMIIMRKKMYYWQIVNMNSDELVYSEYTAKTVHTVKLNWVLQIVKDKADLGIKNMSDEDARKRSGKCKIKIFEQNTRSTSFLFHCISYVRNYEPTYIVTIKSWSMAFIVEAGELIKTSYNFHNSLREL